MAYIGSGISRFNTADELTVTGNAEFNGNATFGDNDKAVFGAGSDLQIFHDGSNSFIDDAGTGVLGIRSNNIALGKYTGENLASFVADGAVTLYYDNASKFATTTDGVDVTGNARLNPTSNPVLRFAENGTLRGLLTSSSSIGLSVETSGALPFIVQTNGSERMRIDSSGNVGIGTAPAGGVQLDVRGTGVLQLVNTDTVQLLASNGGSTLKNVSNNPLIFGTNNAERMRLDGSGRFAVGKVPDSNFNVGCELDPSGFMIISRASGNAGNFNRNNDGNLVTFFRSSTEVGSVSVNSSGTTYNTTSDIRLKTDIEPLQATDKLMAMNPVSYNWKVDPDGPRSMGFIAQEMRSVMPEAVSGTPDGEEMMSMDYGRITPILVSALQDAHRKIEQLESRIAVMENN